MAARYAVEFDDVMDHLRTARAKHEHVTISAIRHIEDLVHVVACVSGSDLAWRDLIDRYERPLIRGCRQWLDTTDAIIFVRQLLNELQRDEMHGLRSLRDYDGTCSLRRWLADRILGRMSLSGFAFSAAEPRPGADPGETALAMWRRPG